MSISLSLGSSQSEQNRQLSQTTAQGSTLIAEGDIHITARGHDDNPDSGDLISRGSLIQAGNNITLDAADDIHLLSAENHESDNSTNESSSAGIGLTFGGGSLVSANDSELDADSNYVAVKEQSGLFASDGALMSALVATDRNIPLGSCLS